MTILTLVLRLIRRLVGWWKRPPTEDDLTGRSLKDAKAGQPARGYSPPPPNDFGAGS